MQVFSTSSASFHFDSSTKVLAMVWNEDSKRLSEDEVKTEISRIVDLVRAFAAKHVVVDARKYPFRENLGIQNWINKTYIPLIMELEVAKYAIVVTEDVFSAVSDIEETEDLITSVEYFTKIEDAYNWIK